MNDLIERGALFEDVRTWLLGEGFIRVYASKHKGDDPSPRGDLDYVVVESNEQLGYIFVGAVEHGATERKLSYVRLTPDEALTLAYNIIKQATAMKKGG